MRRNERIDDETVAQLAAMRGHQSSMWTALPGIISSVNLAKMTAEVQPAIQGLVTAANGTKSWITMPVLVDCPIVFPSGGGYTLTFPLKAGDECLVVFASRCIDAWWQSGGVQAQAELRMHDLSDGFVIPGGRSQPRVIGSISATDVVLRNDTGSSSVAIKSTGDVAITTLANLTINAAQVNIVGDVNTTGALRNNGVSVGSTHKHSGVQSGGSNTGNPT